MSHTVKATREGLVDKTTSTGWVIDTTTPFVALPSTRAKNEWIWLRNPLNGAKCCAQVKDTGPHYTHDDNYVYGDARPEAEFDVSNGAGIDLGEAVWSLLGMTDNTNVEWGFVEFPPAVTT